MTTKANLLHDSLALNWSLYESAKLKTVHCELLTGECDTWISVATIWEIEIKRHIGKLPLPKKIWEQARQVGHQFLPIEVNHAQAAATLPMHRRDPFDRMLIAQAMAEGLTILTADRAFRAYDVTVA